MSTPVHPHPIIDDSTGAKAIEVAALLGDSVVNVKHCIDPKSGKISSATWGMLAASATFLLLSVVAFAIAVGVAAHNHAALDQWVHAGRPAYAFRPEQLGLGLEWMAFGGLAIGIVSFGLGLARMRAERRTPYYRIGTAPGVELPMEASPAPDFPLVAPSLGGDDFVFNYSTGIDGELLVDGTSTPLSQLAASGRARPSTRTVGALELPIPIGAKIRARAGLMTFVVSAVGEPRRHVSPLFAAVERRVTAYFAGSLAAHLVAIALLQLIPVDDGAAAFGIDTYELVAINTSSVEHEQPTPDQTRDLNDGTGDSGGTARPSALDPGTSGKPDQTDKGRIAIKDNHVDPQLARKQAIEEAQHIGIIGATSMLNASAFDQLLATGKVDSGFDEQSVYGAVDGSAIGEARGTFGFARLGSGRGGGCMGDGCGLIGTGTTYGTIGIGDHAGDGMYKGPGIGGPHGRGHDKTLPAIPGRPTIGGTLDKDMIRRYIQRNLPKITYCYEHELIAHPSIEGEVVVNFFISPTGKVQASQGTGFDATVASCVADVVGDIAFPRVPDGGASVKYPFTFRATGR